MVGALLWVATTTRPDISVPVATLAKYQTKPTTRARVNARRKTIKHLLTTKDDGIIYSPQREQEFRKIYIS